MISLKNVCVNIHPYKHAPLKSKTIKGTPPPFINGILRKEIFQKCMLRNKYFKNRSHDNWDKYKSQRNKVTKLRRLSIRKYFQDRCENNNKPHEFWKTMKPFLSDKNKNVGDNIMLRENDRIICKPEDVCNVFNDFYTNIADNIGFDDSIPVTHNNTEQLQSVFNRHEHHLSIAKIRENVSN